MVSEQMKQSLDEYRLLGRSGLRVSPLCMGCMTFGSNWGIGESNEECRKVFDHYVDKGGNFFDTANIYQDGHSEMWLGDYMSSIRSQLVIATKFTFGTRRNAIDSAGTTQSIWKNSANLNGNHRKSLAQSVSESLARMQTGYIDVLYVHCWEYRTPVEEVMRALDDCVRSGKVLYVAISDAPAWIISRANTIAELRGWSKFIGLQTRYNLLDRSFEHDLEPMCADMGIGAIPWGILAEGFLTGKYDRSKPIEGARSDSVKVHTSKDRNWDILEGVKQIAEEVGKSPAQVAMNWTMQKGSITSPLIGAKTLKQLEENLGCLDFVLSPKQMAKLDSLSTPARHELPFPQSFTKMALGGFLSQHKIETPARYHDMLKFVTEGDAGEFITSKAQW